MNKMQELTTKLENICKKSKLRDSSSILSESQDFIYANRKDLLQRYSGYWIAVHRQRVIATNRDLLDLVSTLRKGDTPLEYISLDMLSTEEIPLAL